MNGDVTVQKLQKLEQWRSEDTPLGSIITYTTDQLIFDQNKTKSKLQIQRICQNFTFWIEKKRNISRDTPSEVAW